MRYATGARKILPNSVDRRHGVAAASAGSVTLMSCPLTQPVTVADLSALHTAPTLVDTDEHAAGTAMPVAKKFAWVCWHGWGGGGWIAQSQTKRRFGGG